MSHSKQNSPDDRSSNEPLAGGIKHAEASYKNAQDVIKFIDTKAGVIAGFAFIGIGVILQGIKTLLNLNEEMQTQIVEMSKLHPAYVIILCGASLLSIILGLLCIWYVVRCVTARPPSIASKLKHTILFPIFNENKDYGFARSYFEKIEAGLTPREIAEEYSAQLLNVGAILYKKIMLQRRAAMVFLAQLVGLAITGAALLLFSLQILNHRQGVSLNDGVESSQNTPSPQTVHAPKNSTPVSTP